VLAIVGFFMTSPAFGALHPSFAFESFLSISWPFGDAFLSCDSLAAHFATLV
jgi:hypothetical protein